jgi:5-methylcytosine-specific restriction endonuclease McrA
VTCSHDVTPGQFVSVAYYGAWMRGAPLRAPGKRRGIPSRWRVSILRHHNHRCTECGTTTDIQVEHVVPVAFGGSNEPANLTVLCGTHNRARWSPEFRALLEAAA